MNRIYYKLLLLIFMLGLLSFPKAVAQVSDRNALVREAQNLSKDSLITLLRAKDSLLSIRKRDSINMANLIVNLEFNRDSLHSALSQSIYRHKLDSAERMRRYLNFREFNRKSRQGFYTPIGIIDNDSVRSNVKEVVDLLFEDTAYNPKPHLLKASVERLLNHLGNDSIYFRIVNAKKDTVPFILKKDRVDSTAFFVMNSTNDSARIFIRSLDKNTIYMWVNDDLMLKHLLKNKGEPEGIDIRWQDPGKFRVARKPYPVPIPKYWYLKTHFSMTFNQYAFLNWARGGNTNVALNADVKSWANYAKGNISWTNYFWFNYGVQKAELVELRKSNDVINVISNLSHKAFKKFDYTLGLTYSTQGFRGYAYPNDSVPVSKFMAPADLKLKLGLTYRPSPKLTINMSPVQGQFRFVLDTTIIDQTKYGLKADQRMNAQLGASVTVDHNTKLMNNVSMVNHLELFSNYIDHPEMINFIWRMDLAFKINKYFSTTFHLESVYDNRMLIPLYEIKDGKKVKVGEGKRIQFYEFLGLTFIYYL
jgi:hypothetical protein